MTNYDTGSWTPSGPSFDTTQFGDVELVGTLMSFKDAREQFWSSIGIGGSIIAAPLIYNNTIYVGACDKNFYAITMDGKEKWRFPVQDVISFWAIAHDGVIYFTSFDRNIYAITEDGNEVWRFQTNDQLHGPPVYHDGRIYLCSRDNNLYVLHARTGEFLWKYQTNGPTYVPTIGNGRIYFGSYDNNLYCLNMDGQLLWKIPFPDRVITWPAPLVNGVIITGCWNNTIYGLDAETGTQKWTFKTLDVPFPRVAWNNRLYSGSRDCNCYCIDVNTGQLIWKFPAQGFTGLIPSVANGRAFFPSMDQNVYCLEANTGRLLWKFQTDGPVIGVRAHEDKVYFGSFDCHLYCVDATGRVVWKFRTNSANPSEIKPPGNKPDQFEQTLTVTDDAPEDSVDRYRESFAAEGGGSSVYKSSSQYIKKHRYGGGSQ
ncbi:MAG: PQQ-binding-like beta-propeller repeat protein [Nanoarchaeota archaeon]|nr:PQQ-binding-like beta-propeller repeat protein [Nanoarchaeota archaeon]